MSPKAVLLATMLLVTAAYTVLWAVEARRRRSRGGAIPDLTRTGIGFVTNFFDTLGIGSFATTTTLFRLRKLVADENIPGTLNVGHALPTVVQALIFILTVTVGPVTLIAMILASVLGACLGAGIVARLNRRAIQIGMGAALLVAAALFTGANLEWLPGGGTETSLV